MERFSSLLPNCSPYPKARRICCCNLRKQPSPAKNPPFAEFGKQEGVQILGYTEKIADFMAAADVLFTKPGGLTTTEAAVKGIPIVHTRPIPGCETKNLAFYTERGLSLTSQKLHGQILAGRKLMSNDELRHSMCTAQHTVIPPNAAEKTYQLLCQLFSSAYAVSDDTAKRRLYE